MNNNKRNSTAPKRAKYTFTSFDMVKRADWCVKVSTTTLGSILVVLRHNASGFVYCHFFDNHDQAAAFIDSYFQPAADPL